MPRDVAEAPDYCKPEGKRRNRDCWQWYRAYPQQWLNGTRHLSPLARAAYADILSLIYLDADGRIPESNKWVACALHFRAKDWRKAKNELLATGKLFIRDGYIYNAKANEVHAERVEAVERKAKRVPKESSKRTPRSPQGDLPFGTISNEINGGMSTESESESEVIKVSKQDRLLVVDGNVVADAPLAGLREDQLKRYHHLATTWGMKPGAMAFAAPAERTFTDTNLRNALSAHEGLAPEIVLLAVDATLTAMEAVRHDELRDGRHKGRAGMGPCANYFSKALAGHVTRLRVEEKALEAAARAEMLVQQTMLQKRLDGVASGRSNGHHRNGGMSWDDIAAEVNGGPH